MMLVTGGVASGKRTYLRSLGYRESDMSTSLTDDCAVLVDVQELVRDTDFGSDLGSGADATVGFGPDFGSGDAAVADAADVDAGAAFANVGGDGGADSDACASPETGACAGPDAGASSDACVKVDAGAGSDVRAKADIPALAERIAASKQAVAIVEVGLGIVPLDREERVWRDRVGALARALAARSDVVVRMVCGIPIAVKGDLPQGDSSCES